MNETTQAQPNVTIMLPLNAVQFLLNVLTERSYKEVAGLIGDIERQANAQLQQMQKAAATASAGNAGDPVEG